MDALLDLRLKEGVIQYLVKWKNCLRENSWEPEAKIGDELDQDMTRLKRSLLKEKVKSKCEGSAAALPALLLCPVLQNN